MPYPLDDATANRLVNLFPRVLQRYPERREHYESHV